MHTNIFSARIINAINYLEFLNSKIFDHTALATAKTKQNQLFAAKENQENSTGAYKQGKLLGKLVSNFQNSEKNLLESQDRDCCESSRCNA